MFERIDTLCEQLVAAKKHPERVFFAQPFDDMYPIDQHEESDVHATRCFMQLVRTVGSIIRTDVIDERPRLFEYVQPGRVDLIGSITVYRDQHNHVIVPRDLDQTFLHELGKELYIAASKYLFSQYQQKLFQAIRKRVSRKEISDQFLRCALTSIFEQLLVEQRSLKRGVRFWSGSSHASTIKLITRTLFDAKIIDREAFGVTVRIHGIRFTVSHYNQVVDHLDQFKARIKETPNLAPWLNPLWRDGYKVDTSPDLMQKIKGKFLRAGGTEQGWKWLVKQGWKWAYYFSPISFPHSARAISDIATLRIDKVPYYYEWVGSLLNLHLYNNDKVKQNTLTMIRAAIIAYKKRKYTLKEIKEQFPRIVAYVQEADYVIARNVSWKTLCERQRKLEHQRARERIEQRSKEQVITWEPLLDRKLTQGDLEVVELCNSWELFVEGEYMKHCAAMYSTRCEKGESRIFSIRRGGQRVATVELVFKQKWVISDCRAMHNAKVTDPQVLKLARALARACAKKQLSYCVREVA